MDSPVKEMDRLFLEMILVSRACVAKLRFLFEVSLPSRSTFVVHVVLGKEDAGSLGLEFLRVSGEGTLEISKPFVSLPPCAVEGKIVDVLNCNLHAAVVIGGRARA